MSSFLHRLMQRKLVQWALAYLAAAWVSLQVLDLVGDRFGWPGGMLRGAVIAAGVGFPVTLLLAWYHGERRAQKVSGTELLLLALLLAVGGGLLWRFAPSPTASGTRVAAAAGAKPAPATPTAPAPGTGMVPAKSVAVLPFVSMSAGKDDALFADGLSEEIINSLTRVPDLYVAARTSSFAFRNADDTVPQIAAKLHVATVLEGSVRRAGNRLRITVQLIRASDGFDLWSENYDRNSNDIIAIQEDVARSIAQALKTATDPEALAAMQRAGTRSVPAYQAYLHGLARMSQADSQGDLESGLTEAQADFDRAISLDPDFVDAYARSADLQWQLLRPTSMGSPEADDSYVQRLARLRKDLDHAADLGRDSVERDYYAALRASTDQQYVEATRLMARYFRAYPNSAKAPSYLAGWALHAGDYQRAVRWAEALAKLSRNPQASDSPVPLLIWARDYDRAAEIARQQLRTYPGNVTILYNAHRALLGVGNVVEAAALLPRITASRLSAGNKLLVQMRQLCAEGRTADAERRFAEARTTTTDAAVLWNSLILLGHDDEAQRLLEPLDRPDYLNALAGWLVYPQFDVTRYPRLQAVLVAQGIHRPPATLPPFACKPAAGTAP